MDVYVWVFLCVVNRRQGFFLSSASLDGVGLSGEISFCQLLLGGLHTKNRQRTMPA